MKDLDQQTIDLLVGKAIHGLDAAEQAQLDAALGGADEPDDLALALGAIAAATVENEGGARSRLPDTLRARLRGDADKFFNAGVDDPTPVDDPSLPREASNDARWRLAAVSGWSVAAMLLITLFAWQQGPFGGADDARAQRAALLASASDNQVTPWQPPEVTEFEAVRGDVVWNDRLQAGYLRLSQMPANDPTVAQYQLWIIDPERDEQPVDGGVFNVPAGLSEVIIPITAKLRVEDPTIFAITREQPGGVVVSDGPLLVVASAG